MNYLDVYYRALLDYRKVTKDDRDCLTQRTTVAKANAKSDEIVITRQICDIETDWIKAIEEGLVHVDKAIRENRQFIRSNGEVIDIEKVKNVSKDSVEHLARHSNLITRYHEGEDIVPDRLYTVERLSDYAVYENKFLYMLLCYLRDFITLRYNKILDLEHTYRGDLSMDKEIVMPKRKIDFEIKLKEERKDDPYLKAHSRSHKIIRRISDILEQTHAFLSTPLMEEVSKVPMLKPPVTKTNVLRMNHNFRGALALYEYISAYDKDGYTVREEVQKIGPFKLDMGDEFAEIALLSSFLTYEYGLDVKADLQKTFEIEEQKKRADEIKRHLDQLKSLRRRIKESGENPEEYMLGLEKINRMLELDSQKLYEAKEEIERLNDSIVGLNIQIDRLKDKIEALNQEMEIMQAKLYEKILGLTEQHKKDLENLSTYYQDKIKELCDEHSATLARICQEYDDRIDELNKSHSDEIDRINEECEDKINQITEECEDKVNKLTEECEARVDELLCKIEEERVAHDSAIEKLKDSHKEEVRVLEEKQAEEIKDLMARWHNEANELHMECKASEEKISMLEDEKSKLIDARRLAEARLIAIRKEHGLKAAPFDFTTEASFQELEHQLDVFERFFFAEWKKTKKSIRKNVIKDFFKNMKRAKIRRSSAAGKAEKRAIMNENIKKKKLSQVENTQDKNELAKMNTQAPEKAQAPGAEQAKTTQAKPQESKKVTTQQKKTQADAKKAAPAKATAKNAQSKAPVKPTEKKQVVKKERSANGKQ